MEGVSQAKPGDSAGRPSGANEPDLGDRGSGNPSRYDMCRLLEQVDIVWIYLKLAEVSRKQGLPNLAESYLKQPFNNFTLENGNVGEIFQLEQFKQVYERFKLKMTYC